MSIVSPILCDALTIFVSIRGLQTTTCRPNPACETISTGLRSYFMYNEKI